MTVVILLVVFFLRWNETCEAFLAEIRHVGNAVDVVAPRAEVRVLRVVEYDEAHEEEAEEKRQKNKD